MAVLLATATGQVIAVLDANTSGTRVYGTVNDPLVTATEITNAILGADEYIYQTIIETPNHPLLSTLRANTTVAHAGLLPARVGPVLGITVDSKAPKWATVDEIENDRSNPNSLTLTKKFHIQSIVGMGERLFHNGSASASVDYVAPFALTSACQSPDPMLPAVVALALAEIRQKQGAYTEAAQYWQRRAEFFIAQIRGGAPRLEASEAA